MRLTLLRLLVIFASIWGQFPLLAEALEGKPEAYAPPEPASRSAGTSGASTIDAPAASGSWRRVRSPGGEFDATAFLRTADLDRSDPRLAGLMLRCGERGVEIVIVVVEPFPPRAQPKITLRVAKQQSYFVGSIIPAGAGIRLPVDGMKLANDSWLGSQEVEIKIADGDTAIEGIVPLSGLTAAIRALAATCVLK